MRKIWALFLVAIFVLATTACTRCGAGGQQPTVSDLQNETVALVKQNDDGQWFPYCGGVWVGRSRVLTAKHCTDGEDKIYVLTAGEVSGIVSDPKATHEATVVALAPKYDLSLIDVALPPLHPVAKLAEQGPPVGSSLLMMAHPTLNYWTFCTGLVTNYYSEIGVGPAHDLTGPFMGVASLVMNNGGSGSGVFDRSGNLVGIVSMKSGTPGLGYAIPLPALRGFLTRAPR